MINEFTIKHKATKEDREDVSHMRQALKISAENTFRENMLRSIFKEYALFLQKNHVFSNDIRKIVMNNVQDFILKNKGYVHAGIVKLVQEDVNAVIVSNKKVKEQIQTRFMQKTGPSLVKYGIQDSDMNSVFKSSFESMTTLTDNSRTRAFLDMYYDECVDLIKKSCESMEYSFSSTL